MIQNKNLAKRVCNIVHRVKGVRFYTFHSSFFTLFSPFIKDVSLFQLLQYQLFAVKRVKREISIAQNSKGHLTTIECEPHLLARAGCNRWELPSIHIQLPLLRCGCLLFPLNNFRFRFLVKTE